VAESVPILFVHYGLNWITGSERCLLDLLAHLDRDRFRPVVVCNTEALATAASELGAVVCWSSRFEAQDGFLPDRALVREARRIVREHSIRLIHANDFQPVKWLLPCARSARIPMLLHVHLPSSEENRCYMWAHQVACVVGVSRAAVQGFLNDGLTPKRVKIIYNAVDPDRLSTGDASRLRVELGITTDETVLVAVGSLILRKGVDVLLRGLAQLRAGGNPRVRLLLLGDGPEREPLEMLASSLGLGGMVHFLGRRADAGAILRDAADIALSGSRDEAFPLSVLEAGFFGLPVIATDIPPHREAIEHEGTGLLVPTEDSSALAAAVARLVSDPVLRRRLGQAARQGVKSRFLIGEYTRQFSQLYERLLTEPPYRYGWLGSWTWPSAYGRWLRRAVRHRLGHRGWLEI
jgi:glycosyltransferase involved in cell wall biosynthesis